MHQDFVAKNPHDKQLKQTSKEQLLENRLDNDHILAAAWTNHAWKYGQSQLALSVVVEWQKNCLSMAYQLQLIRQIDPPRRQQKYIDQAHFLNSNKLREIPELRLGHL